MLETNATSAVDLILTLSKDGAIMLSLALVLRQAQDEG